MTAKELILSESRAGRNTTEIVKILKARGFKTKNGTNFSRAAVYSVIHLAKKAQQPIIRLEGPAEPLRAPVVPSDFKSDLQAILASNLPDSSKLRLINVLAN
jgi:hypothetical protein